MLRVSDWSGTRTGPALASLGLIAAATGDRSQLAVELFLIAESGSRRAAAGRTYRRGAVLGGGGGRTPPR